MLLLAALVIVPMMCALPDCLGSVGSCGAFGGLGMGGKLATTLLIDRT
jgi:hypothetical protein